ncbi:hypothetical protein [Clostridium saccharobutylicum]|uniref:Autolysin n=1 Tax=Clostridium saccharobutylicum TaxID=169679 RepID=A0A1S8N5Y2_CLOSA|nr:hypothetical protein [Clostridium saccharobutylicum]OOM11835.1 autolysin [Clostridium saccharobutylicum]
MMKMKKIALGLVTLSMVSILAPATQVYAYYETKKIVIHPVNLLGEQIHGNIEIDAKVVKSSNSDDGYYSFDDPEIQGYRGTKNRIEKISDFKQSNVIVLTEKYECINGTSDVDKKWAYENGNWYYRNINGVYSHGWDKINNTWYFFDAWTSAMKTGWIPWDNKWYYMQADGSMATNAYIGGYYVGSDGAMIS